MNSTSSKPDVSILVVDDDDDVRAALYDELKREYSVTAATCGEEAFAALALRRFDVVISDLKMPDHDGIEVLDFARAQDADVIRILLTGYVDDRAHAALLRPDAPFKVGKPWYDEIEVTLRRALEQRRRAQRLTASLDAAMGLRQVEAALQHADSLDDLGQLLVIEAAGLHGVAAVTASLDGKPLAGGALNGADGWRAELVIDPGGRLRVSAAGHGDEARDLFEHLGQLGQRRAGTLAASRAPDAALRRSRIDELVRQAATGSMTAILLHDLASIIQVFDGAMEQVTTLAEERGDRELGDATADALTAAHDATELFVTMRRFIREGAPPLSPVSTARVVQRAVRQVIGRIRDRATLRAPNPAPSVPVMAAESMLVQVLVAVLDNAAAVSPPGGTVDLDVLVGDTHIVFEITDDGPGVPPELADVLFDPLVWHRPEGMGSGLAVAAHIMRGMGGSIAYRRADGRGACFVVSVRRG